MTLSLSLPDMRLPFDSVCHQQIDAVEAYGVQWAARFMPEPVLDSLRKARAGRIIAHTSSPDAPLELLQVCTRMASWGFWFDDALSDNVDPASPHQLPAILSVIDLLDGRPGTGAAGENVEAGFRDVMEGMNTVLAADVYARWACEMRLWLCSLALQNQQRATPAIPTPAAYKTMRLYSVCSLPSIVPIDATWPTAPVDWDTYWQPQMTALRLIAADVVAWQNDIFSFFAEQSLPGRFWNLPGVYQALGATQGEAMEQAAHDVRNAVAQFQEREAALTPTLTPAQATHIASCKQWMRGVHDWSYEVAERYVGWSELGS
ncbi:hypothetical protein [Streptomyces sp. NPDC091268]|uniref:terpene synthase family protein n=1 Tax=Streptomyces sp. NPDC091268 TaxID=3365979 RepID=UPI0038202F37